jgi:hypothetical protein
VPDLPRRTVTGGESATLPDRIGAWARGRAVLLHARLCPVSALARAPVVGRGFRVGRAVRHGGGQTLKEERTRDGEVAGSCAHVLRRPTCRCGGSLGYAGPPVGVGDRTRTAGRRHEIFTARRN